MSRAVGPLLIGVVTLALVNCAAERSARSNGIRHLAISEADAIARAEEFISVSGYVNADDADPNRIRREALDRGLEAKDLLAQRAGTLLGTACGVSKTVEPGAVVVAFCYDPRWFKPNPGLAAYVRAAGRGVVVASQGRPMQLAHQDLRLASPGIERRSGMDELEALLQRAPFASTGK